MNSLLFHMNFVLICCSDIVDSARVCAYFSVLGLSPGEISDTFWKLKPGEEGADDVVLRLLESCFNFLFVMSCSLCLPTLH